MEYRIIIMKPSCLKVEKATIFLISKHTREDKEPKIKVNKPINIKSSFKNLLNQGALKRNSKYKPAVTKVLECTKEDTGVGAAMAAGSQLQKGKIALFVKDIEVIIIIKTK